jgi:uncharacterized protein RhaS with RHS repeats
MESDPIGLRGGLNTYGYGFLNPVANIDPDGRLVWFGVPAVYWFMGGSAAAVWWGFNNPWAPNGAWGAESRARGRSDPVSGVQPVNPGRDCDGNCNPCPPDEIWEAPGNAHGSTGGTHYHGIIWNQNPDTCECFPKRVSGSSPSDLR